MSDREHRHAVSPHGVVNAQQRLQEVDDQVGLDRRDRLVNRAEAATKGGSVREGVGGSAEERDPATVGDGEPRARDRLDASDERLLKECRQAPVLIRPDEDGGDAMSVSLQHLLHRDRLRHVPATLALHREHHFHGIE